MCIRDRTREVASHRRTQTVCGSSTSVPRPSASAFSLPLSFSPLLPPSPPCTASAPARCCLDRTVCARRAGAWGGLTLLWMSAEVNGSKMYAREREMRLHLKRLGSKEMRDAFVLVPCELPGVMRDAFVLETCELLPQADASGTWTLISDIVGTRGNRGWANSRGSGSG
eukprot:1383431-Rhodomonas_salina.1